MSTKDEQTAKTKSFAVRSTKSSSKPKPPKINKNGNTKSTKYKKKPLPPTPPIPPTPPLLSQSSSSSKPYKPRITKPSNIKSKPKTNKPLKPQKRNKPKIPATPPPKSTKPISNNIKSKNKKTNKKKVVPPPPSNRVQSKSTFKISSSSRTTSRSTVKYASSNKQKHVQSRSLTKTPKQKRLNTVRKPPPLPPLKISNNKHQNDNKSLPQSPLKPMVQHPTIGEFYSARTRKKKLLRRQLPSKPKDICIYFILMGKIYEYIINICLEYKLSQILPKLSQHLTSNDEILAIITRDIGRSDRSLSSISKKLNNNKNNDEYTYDMIIKNPIFIYKNNTFHGSQTFIQIGFKRDLDKIEYKNIINNNDDDDDKKEEEKEKKPYIAILSCTEHDNDRFDMKTTSNIDDLPSLNDISGSFRGSSFSMKNVLNLHSDNKNSRYIDLKKCVENMGYTLPLGVNKEQLIFYVNQSIENMPRKQMIMRGSMMIKSKIKKKHRKYSINDELENDGLSKIEIKESWKRYYNSPKTIPSIEIFDNDNNNHLKIKNKPKRKRSRSCGGLSPHHIKKINKNNKRNKRKNKNKIENGNKISKNNKHKRYNQSVPDMNEIGLKQALNGNNMIRLNLSSINPSKLELNSSIDINDDNINNDKTSSKFTRLIRRSLSKKKKDINNINKSNSASSSPVVSFLSESESEGIAVEIAMDEDRMINKKSSLSKFKDMIQRKLSGSDQESNSDFNIYYKENSSSSENEVCYAKMLQISNKKKDIQYEPKLPTLNQSYSRQKERKRKKKKIERELNTSYYSPSPSRSHSRSGSKSKSKSKKKKKKKHKTKHKDVFNRDHNIMIESDDNAIISKQRKYRKKKESKNKSDKKSKCKKNKDKNNYNIKPPIPSSKIYESTVPITRRRSKHKEYENDDNHINIKNNNKLKAAIIVQGYLNTNIGNDSDIKWKKIYYTFNRDRLLCSYSNKNDDLSLPIDKISLIHGRCSFNINSNGITSSSQQQTITITIKTPKKPIIKHFRGTISSLEKWKRAFLF